MPLRLTEKQAADLLGTIDPLIPGREPPLLPPQVIVHRLTGFETTIMVLGGWLVGFICGLAFPH